MKSRREEPQLKGFSTKALKFFQDLAENNDREWFQANKAVYDLEVRAPMDSLVTSLAAKFKSKKIDIKGDPKQSIFRINRDVRFARDKSPYKTNIGAAMTRDGGKNTPGVVYIHVEPVGSFVACGFYQPEPAILDALRKQIVANPKSFVKLVSSLEKQELPLVMTDTLKRLPRGFESVNNEAIQPFIKLKSFIVRRPLSKTTLADSEQLVDEIVSFAEASYPLLKFGWAAIEEEI